MMDDYLSIDGASVPIDERNKDFKELIRYSEDLVPTGRVSKALDRMEEWRRLEILNKVNSRGRRQHGKDIPSIS